jgi:dTDP-4-dehydrorhamnose reductase
MNRRWLITGATGKLGGYLVEQLHETQGLQGAQIITASRTQLNSPFHFHVDLTIPGHLHDLLNISRPTHIIHLAGTTSPSKAAAQPSAAWHANVEVSSQLARYAAENRCWLLMSSTDFVFRGDAGRPYSEQDCPAPRTVYGATKLAAEREVLDRGGAVARLSMLYGIPMHANTPSTFCEQLRRLRQSQVIDVVVDEWRTPLWLRDAAIVLAELGAIEFQGLIHIGGPKRLTAEDLMCQCAELLNVTPLFHRISRHALCREHRPKDVALDVSKLDRLLPGLRPGPLRAEALCPWSPHPPHAGELVADRTL